jgi:DNA-binding MarR family transcriptional regulator
MQRIFVLIGIINQLATTRLNRVLKELDLPMAQFSLLTHLSQNPEKGWTITQLAKVMEVNQPAMTKTSQRLLKKGFLKVESDEKDKRIRFISVTDQGLQALTKAWEKLLPDVMEMASAWKPPELTQLIGLLEKLKNQLDESRD